MKIVIIYVLIAVNNIYNLKIFILLDYSRSPKDRRSRDEYRTNHDRISPEVIYYFFITVINIIIFHLYFSF